MRALLVAPDDGTRELLAAVFRGRGHRVDACVDEAEARRALAGEAYHYVLVDLDVPGAVDLCRAAHARAAAGDGHVLALTPEETPEHLRAAFEAGADDYLVKPVTRAALQLRLAVGERALAARRHRREAERGRELGEQRYRTLVEAMAEGVFEVDADGLIRSANSSLSRITGYSANELLGHSADELLVDAAVRERLPGRTLLGPGVGSEQYTIPLRGKEGSTLWVTLTGAPVPDAGGGGRSVGVLQDVTEQKRAEEALRHREEYFRVLWENTSDLVSILDIEARVLYQSVSSRALLGWPEDELVGRDFLELVHPDDRDRFARALNDSLETTEPVGVEARLHLRDGDWRIFEATCKNVIDNPVIGGVIVTSRDVTERRRVEAALDRERTFFQQLFRNSPTGIVLLDGSDRVVDCNRSFTDLFQYEIAEIKGRPLTELIVPPELRDEARELSQTVFARQTVDRETVRRRKDGTAVDVAVLGYPVELEGRRIGAFGLYTDITERKAAERKLFHDAFHDALTGLPNRMLVAERLERALRRARRHREYLFALLFLDLDGFKAINDTHGHAAGDDFLVEVARRLEGLVRPGDTVARLGGDEFTVVLDDLDHPAAASSVAQRILDVLAEPFSAAGEEVRASGSIGVAFSYTGYDSVEDLMRDADLAMYRAKTRGKACFEIFDAEMQESARARLERDAELRQAIEQEALALVYQPIVELGGGRAVGFEALVRWEHPRQGGLEGGEIRRVAQETGLGRMLGRWTLRQVCRQAAAWEKRLARDGGIRLAVDLAVEELRRPEFLADLDAALRETGARPERLAFEVRDAAIADAIAGSGELLAELRRRGVALAVDHFGSGPTSLAALHRFGVSRLKVDAAFVARLDDAHSDGKEVVRAATALGQSLGIEVVALGVDTPAQAASLQRLGVALGQGRLHPAASAKTAI